MFIKLEATITYGLAANFIVVLSLPRFAALSARFFEDENEEEFCFEKSVFHPGFICG
jgi:hypothetical protein